MKVDKVAVQLRVRLTTDGQVVMGPGKADLLDGIRQQGSIAAAGRAMGMSYKRAWQLVDAMNRAFDQPVVAAAIGGSRGGGAELTGFGADLLARYRRIQATCDRAASDDLALIASRLAAPAD